MDKNFLKPKLHKDNINHQYKSLLDNLPGIVFCCLNDKNWTLKFISEGCNELTGYCVDDFMSKKNKLDFIIHPDDQSRVYDEIYSKIDKKSSYQIEYRIISSSKETKWVLETGHLVTDKTTKQEYIEGLILDINNKKISDTLVQEIIRFDQTTGLANKAYLYEFLNRRLSALNKNMHATMIVIINFNKYSKLRDLYSEKCIKYSYETIAKILQKKILASDFIAFIENRYFVYVTTFTRDKLYDIEIKIEKLRREISTTIVNDQFAVNEILLAGVSLYPDDGNKPDDLISKAIFSCAQTDIKYQNEVGLSFYDENNYQRYKRHLRIENDLPASIEKNQLYLVYQPIFNIPTRKIHALEVLVRWNHPELGLIPPASFIPIAEHSGLINHLENWIIKQAILEYHKKIIPLDGKIKLSINISPTHLKSNEVYDLISKLVTDFAIKNNMIIIEITETSLDMLDSENLNIKHLSKGGYSLAIDDFGTGQSSLERLVTIPFKKIKVDKSLIHRISNKTASFLIKNIIGWSNQTNIEIVAEGIENKEQLRLLVKYGCHLGQGFLLAKPMTIDELILAKLI